MTPGHKMLVLCAMAAITMGMTACSTVPLDQVTSFADASSLVGKSALEGYEVATTATIDQKLYVLAAVPGDQALTEELFQPVYSGDNARLLEKKVKIVVLLDEYAQALLKLAEVDVDEDLQEAAAGLNDALGGLAGTFQEVAGAPLPLPEKGLSMISTIVYAIGKQITYQKKVEAIKRIVTEYHPAVEAAGRLIEQDFGDGDGLWEIAVNQMRTSAASLSVEFERVRSDPAAYRERLSILTDMRDRYRLADTHEGFFVSVSEAAGEMVTAHDELRQAADADFRTEGLVKALGKFMNEAKDVARFYKKLQDESKA